MRSEGEKKTTQRPLSLYQVLLGENHNHTLIHSMTFFEFGGIKKKKKGKLEKSSAFES